MSGAVQCRACGERWERDPILEVKCPDCRAPIGAQCRRPSGHKASSYHNARDHAAVAAGFYGRCSAAPVQIALI